MPFKILMVLLESPIPFGNAGSRWFYVLLKELIKRGHHVDLLIATDNFNEVDRAKDYFPNINIYGFPFSKKKSKLNNFLKPHAYKFGKEFRKKLESLNPSSYDIIHAEQTWCAWPLQKYKEKTLLNIHYLQCLDLRKNHPRNLKDKLLKKRWLSTEKKLIKNFPHVRSCTERMTDTIQSWHQKKSYSQKLYTSPFGIDASLYKFNTKYDDQAQRITLIGNMNWYPTLSAAKTLLKDLWPKIKNKIPQATCHIVGWNAKSALKDYLKIKDIEILENVKDIQPYFDQASVLVYLPNEGSGIKIKVMEAMLFGVPIVTNKYGSEGLNAESGTHLLEAKNNDHAIDLIQQLLSQPKLRQHLRVNARSFIEKEYCAAMTVAPIESVYKKIIDVK